MPALAWALSEQMTWLWSPGDFFEDERWRFTVGLASHKMGQTRHWR